MRRRLREQKVDIDIAIAKSLEGAYLTPEEVHELSAMSNRDLMSEYDLDYLLAGEVLKHVTSEMLRLQAQDQQTRVSDAQFGLSSLTHLKPIPEKPPGLTETRMRRLIRQYRRELKVRRARR